MNNAKLIASAPSKEELQKLAIRFWCGTIVSLNDDGSISNSSGVIEGARWVEKKKRFRLEMTL